MKRKLLQVHHFFTLLALHHFRVHFHLDVYRSGTRSTVDLTYSDVPVL